VNRVSRCIARHILLVETDVPSNLIKDHPAKHIVLHSPILGVALLVHLEKSKTHPNSSTAALKALHLHSFNMLENLEQSYMKRTLLD
jgi:hypothetical protein